MTDLGTKGEGGPGCARRLADWIIITKREIAHSNHSVASGRAYDDPTTRQVRLFLKAKRPNAALTVALFRAFPWRATGVLAVAVAAKIWA